MKPVFNPNQGGRYVGSVGAACPNCNGPIGVEIFNTAHLPHGAVAQLLGKFLNEPYAPDAHGLDVAEVWPAPPQPTVPAHVSPSIERAVLQAERNYQVAGNEEAAAMMYRRSLELAFKEKFPGLSGTLATRIKQLVGDKILPQAMGDWADEIRALGNDAAHDPVEVDRNQLTMIRGFADATLRYLYTLPAEIEARRKLP